MEKDIGRIKEPLPIATNITKSYSVWYQGKSIACMRDLSCYCKKCFIERNLKKCENAENIGTVGVIDYGKKKFYRKAWQQKV